jgi:hypothetical protein
MTWMLLLTIITPWGIDSQPLGFYDAKGACEEVAKTIPKNDGPINYQAICLPGNGFAYE